MGSEPGTFKTCGECGATIYPEHLETHRADLWEGRLLCPHCLHEKKPPEPAPEPLVALADDDKPRVVGGRSSQIHGFNVGGIGAVQAAEAPFRRPLLANTHATRCRTFHCKLTDASIMHLNSQINEWVDAHDDVEIKFAVSTVGIVEGKSSDQHLIVTIFY
jgi:hypothetical protein